MLIDRIIIENIQIDIEFIFSYKFYMKNIKYIFSVLILNIYANSIASNLSYETTDLLKESSISKILESIVGLQDYPNIFKPTDVFRTIEELQREEYSILPFQELPLHLQKLKNFFKEILILKSISESEVESELKLEFQKLQDELRNLSYIFASIINSQRTSSLELVEPLRPEIIFETHYNFYLNHAYTRYMSYREPLREIVWHTHSEPYTVIVPIIEPNTLFKIKEREQSILSNTVFLFRGDIDHSSPPVNSNILRSFILFRFDRLKFSQI